MSQTKRKKLIRPARRQGINLTLRPTTIEMLREHAVATGLSASWMADQILAEHLSKIEDHHESSRRS